MRQTLRMKKDDNHSSGKPSHVAHPHHLIEFLGAPEEKFLGTPPKTPDVQELQQSSAPSNDLYLVFAGQNEVKPNSDEACYVNFT